MPHFVSWNAKENEEETEQTTCVKKKRIMHINILKNFSGHKFARDHQWGLVTQSWTFSGREKRRMSTFFSYNFHIFNFIFFFSSFFLSAQLFLTIGLWVRRFNIVGFGGSYQRYCEMKCNYVSVSGCKPKGIWLKLKE